MQSKLDRLTNYVESRLEKASKQQTDVMLQMSEQIARAVVAAEPTAQSNRIEQMSGAMMTAQGASSTQLLTKESNQDKEVSNTSWYHDYPSPTRT